MFLHRGVCHPMFFVVIGYAFPGVAALTMNVVMSLSPGKKPVAFRSHA